MSKDERTAVNEFSLRLRNRFPAEVEAIRLYGSKARGTSHTESDVDLLILVKERTPPLDDAIIDIVCDVLNEFGVFIETVTLTSSAYREAVDRQYPFAINVERDAVSL